MLSCWANLEARRDWGYARNTSRRSGKCLQCDSAGDIVIGTGEAHSVREFFLEEAFAYQASTGRSMLSQSSARYMRPLEVDCLIAEQRKAREKLGWQARIGFKRSGRHHVDADMEAAGLVAPGKGKEIFGKQVQRSNHWPTKFTVAGRSRRSRSGSHLRRVHGVLGTIGEWCKVAAMVFGVLRC